VEPTTCRKRVTIDTARPASRAHAHAKKSDERIMVPAGNAS
jgi:hypothetical protein